MFCGKPRIPDAPDPLPGSGTKWQVGGHGTCLDTVQV
jgi:hypothetical protein